MTPAEMLAREEREEAARLRTQFERDRQRHIAERLRRIRVLDPELAREISAARNE
jgi:uncharacterized protein YnzC (UPF0291/DUF896 family)